eukprot:8753226-Alexandrium_andersonii.AAC.1
MLSLLRAIDMLRSILAHSCMVRAWAKPSCNSVASASALIQVCSAASSAEASTPRNSIASQRCSSTNFTAA